MKKQKQFFLFFLLFGTMLIFGLIENIKGISYPLIRDEFNATWDQQGLMVSVLSAAYVSFSVIAGIFISRFGIKPSLLLGYTALSVGLFSVFFSPGFFPAVAALFLVFAGFGFFEVGVNALASGLFLKKTALLMSILHAFYGIGAMLGPGAAGLVIRNADFGWRHAYLFSLPLALLFFIPMIFTPFRERPFRESRLQKSGNDENSFQRKTFFDALKSPMVWLFSVTTGFAIIIEMSTPNWGVMYFFDIYEIDPGTGGAAFLSRFFLLFTLSRLICGLFVEKIGYMKTLLGIAVIVLIIFCVGFSLGEKGIIILPALGFFIALLWPTLMAVSVCCFGKDAPVFSSAIIAIGGLMNAVVQYLVGITNHLFGPAWGYRSTIVYTVFLIAMLLLLWKKLKTQGTVYPLKF